MSAWNGQWSEEHKMQPADTRTPLERRLLAALTPSAATKAAYMGDGEACDTCKGHLTWDIMQLAMALIRKEARV